MKRNINRLICKGTYNPTRCAYCGKVLSNDKTRDHVPPRFIFKEYNNNISEERITVPCCINCNQDYSVIEQRLVPLFNHIHKGTANLDQIEAFNQNGDLNILMTKIALGYRHHESAKIQNCFIKPTISYFLSKDVDSGIIEDFKKIRCNNFIEDISSNVKFSGLLITCGDAIIASTPTDIFSEFWHEYHINNDYVRMSFYDILFVQVQF